jgi:hypothetical protein
VIGWLLLNTRGGLGLKNDLQTQLDIAITTRPDHRIPDINVGR